MSTKAPFVTLAFAAILACVCTGCLTVDPEKFESQYNAWVPVGTPVAEAERVMKAHDFKCHEGEFASGRPWAGPILVCRKENRFLNRTWIVNLFLEQGRVVGANDQIFTDFLRIAPGS